jgi:hypothetical protein
LDEPDSATGVPGDADPARTARAAGPDRPAGPDPAPGAASGDVDTAAPDAAADPGQPAPVASVGLPCPGPEEEPADPDDRAPVSGTAPVHGAGEADARTTEGDRVDAEPGAEPASPQRSGAGPENGAGAPSPSPSPQDLVQAVADFVDDLVEDGDEPS